MIRNFLLASLLFPAFAAHAQSVPSNTGNCLNAQEADLATLVNNLRLANGLSAVPVSRWVASTAQWHAWDLVANNPMTPSCNAHSWSGARPSQWTAVCYGGGGSAAQMWNKPRQVSGNAYTGNGYENAAGADTAADALWMWQQSAPHLDVILNRGIWASKTWRGMGVAMYGGYALLWFGDANDSAGSMAPCTGGGVPIDEVFDTRFE